MKARTHFVMLAAIALLASCSTEQDAPTPQEEIGKVYLEVTAAQPATPETRMTYAENKVTPVGMIATWSANEQLAVVSYSGTGTVTPNILSEHLTGGKEAATSTTFAGDITAASTDDKAGEYNFYRPVVTEESTIGVIDNTAHTVTYDYTKQTSAVNSPDGMSSLDVLYTSAAAPVGSITLKRASTILRFVLTLPADAPAIKKVELVTESAVFYEKLQLTFAANGTAMAKGTGDRVNTISVEVTGDATSDAARSFTVYMLTPNNDDDEGITIPAESVWIDAIGVDGKTYRQYFSSLETSSHKLEAGKTYTFQPSTLEDLYTLLSVNETSNSYIIKANTRYAFDATVRGNGVAATSAFPTITASIGKDAGLPSVLWSMGGTGNYSNGNSVVINPSSETATGRITFTSATTTNGGNAVIVLKSGSEVLWSWHIWLIPDYDPSTGKDKDQDYGTGDYYDGTVTMMPYNLGAVNTSGTAADANAYNDGLLYQWGRKDPFLGSVGYSGTNPTKGEHYYYNVADFTYTGTGPVTPTVAYQNPTTFYIPTDWADVRYDNLWGNGSGTYAGWSSTSNSVFPTKTLFDPCPPGYVVAPRNTWSTNFTKESSTWGTNGRTFTYDGTNTTFYPASGLRLNGEGITLNNVGAYGYNWSSSPGESEDGRGGFLKFFSGDVYPLNHGHRADGYSVRCARIETD
jgi:hypothetical protein